MEKLTLSSFGLLLMFVLLSGCGQICMKIGLRGDKIPIVKSPLATIVNIVRVMMRPWLLAGLALYVMGAFSWLVLLSKIPLSVAYPMISLGYVFVVFMSRFVLHEKVRWGYASVGLICIAIGVSFIGFGMGQHGH